MSSYLESIGPLFFLNYFIFTMELCSGGRVHQPLRDRGGEGPAHGEAAPSLGFDTQVLFLDSKLQIISAPRILAVAFQLGFHSVSCYICPMSADYMHLQLPISPRISQQPLDFSSKVVLYTQVVHLSNELQIFLNVVICAANCANVSSFYFCICRSIISAFVLFGVAQAIFATLCS